MSDEGKRDKLDFSIFLDEYLTDAREGFQTVNNALLSLEKDFSRRDLLDEIFRVVHTLKSSSKMLEFTEISDFAHTSEDFIDSLRKNEMSLNQASVNLLFEITDTLETMVRERANAKKTGIKSDAVEDIYQNETIQKIEDVKQKIEGKNIIGNDIKTVKAPVIEKIQTVRINVDILDSLFNLVGELIINKNRMNNLIADIDRKELRATMSTQMHIIDELQEKVSEARMVPVDEVFRKFPRMVRDLAASAGKEIDLVVEGSEIELDKSVLDAIGEPLIHLLRNAIDHGIEPPDERQKFGKKRKGIVRLIAGRAENHILIEVGDDGRGIDIPLMRDIAVKKGFTKTEEIGLLEDKDTLKLIFKPGFSSSENVTDVSGRGVGLDIVKSATERLNGMVEVATEKGRGVRFILKLPISPAIIQTLMVSVGNHVFAIPSDMAIETIEIGNEDIKEIKDREVLVIKNEILPFLRLSSVLGVPHNVDQKKIAAVIIHVGDAHIGIGVDSVIGQMENIVKPFDPIAQGFRGFSGGTILGDGSIALLLDIPKLLGFEKLRKERYAV